MFKTYHPKNSQFLEERTKELQSVCSQIRSKPKGIGRVLLSTPQDISAFQEHGIVCKPASTCVGIERADRKFVNGQRARCAIYNAGVCKGQDMHHSVQAIEVSFIRLHPRSVRNINGCGRNGLENFHSGPVLSDALKRALFRPVIHPTHDKGRAISASWKICWLKGPGGNCKIGLACGRIWESPSMDQIRWSNYLGWTGPWFALWLQAILFETHQYSQLKQPRRRQTLLPQVSKSALSARGTQKLWRQHST